jgi:FMN phosphatase YigB (HAD superfamily)
MLKAVFFDLDGTLLPLNEDLFTKLYFGMLCEKLEPLLYKPEELINVIWSGTKNMYLNDGSKTKEEVFWDTFVKFYGTDKLQDKDFIDLFYTNEFKKTKDSCDDNPYVENIIKCCHDLNLITVLSTNPIFPKDGTLTRMSFIGLKETDFDYITVYENSNYCKPNPAYFKMLLNKYNLKSDEVIVFGNNTYEDGEAALACGIKCYMVGDYIINHPKTIHEFEHIQMKDVINVIKSYFK